MKRYEVEHLLELFREHMMEKVDKFLDGIEDELIHDPDRNDENTGVGDVWEWFLEHG